MTLTLDFLPQTAFTFLLIFARIGALTMTLPGVGDRTVPNRIRLVMALALTLILYPIVQPGLPSMPEALNAVLEAMFREMILGAAIGLSVRMILSGLMIAGAVIAVQTGLAFAQNIDPAQGVQSTLMAAFLSVLSVTLIFATDLHHLMLAAMHDSYQLFPAGQAYPTGDFAELIVVTVSNAFRIAVQLAAPFLVFGLIFYLGVGLLTRLIPQVQIFFIAMPANILLGFVLLFLLLSTVMFWYLDYFSTAMKPYLL